MWTLLWILLYILFATAILSFFFWSTILLQKQKKTWAEFAKRHNLIYRKAPALMQASAVEGLYKGFRFGLFSEGRIDDNSRGMVRYRTVIEFLFDEGMPAAAAMGDVSAAPVIRALNYGPSYHPEWSGWNKQNVITTNGKTFLKEYLTSERLETVNKFLNMQGATNMFVFDGVDSFIRIETADTLHEMDKLENLVNKLLPIAQALKLSDSERRRFLGAEDSRREEIESSSDPDHMESAREEEDPAMEKEAEKKKSASGFISKEDMDENAPITPSSKTIT